MARDVMSDFLSGFAIGFRDFLLGHDSLLGFAIGLAIGFAVSAFVLILWKWIKWEFSGPWL
jgi:hypothetical protein